MHRAGLIILVVGLVAFLSVGNAQPVEDQLEDNNSNANPDVAEESRRGGGGGVARAKAYATAGANAQYQQPTQGSLPGLAAICYDCADCPEVYFNTTVKMCSIFDPSKKNRCVTYTEKYQNMQKPWVVRGCVSDRGTCAELQQSHQSGYVKLVSCYECVGDRCNGVARELPSFIIAVLALVVTPLVAKKVLS